MEIQSKIKRFKCVLGILRKQYALISSVETTEDKAEFLAPFSAHNMRRHESTTLDLGCGKKIQNPFKAEQAYGTDISGAENDFRKVTDLSVNRIPFDDESFDYITAFDFLEHIPRIVYLPEKRLPFIEIMNEVHRCLKPNGIFLSWTPAYPFNCAFRDPTHVNIITADTFPMYFCEPVLAARVYGFFGNFEIQKEAFFKEHLVTILKKINAS